MASAFAENLVGRVLDGRYVLLNLVGVGASARVYRAEDRKLRRFVAVKVLHASFADDEGFVRRFRREAEALAPLNHGNIVTIYDVNDGANAAGDPPYLVTEYLGGGTLLDLLDSGYRLSPSQAARMALEAARGLEFAHARGLVHRDVKPANLLFGEDQHVRIADFGLATVLADFGRTMQGGAPVGSPRYQSPEQARGTRGVPIDGRSDVYSLALVVVEAVTGSLPFVADTWAGQALARLDGAIPTSDELGPLVPVVQAAGALDPEDRLDAAGLVRALETLVRTLPRAEPLPLDGSRLAASRVLVDRDPTRHVGLADDPVDTRGGVASIDIPLDGPSVPAAPHDAPVVLDDAVAAASLANERARRGGVFDITLDDEPSSAPSTGGAGPGVAAKEPKAAKAPKAGKAPKGAGAAGAPNASKPARVAKEPRADRGDRPRRRRWPLLAALAVLLVGAVVTVLVLNRTPTHPVPDLRAKTVAQARSLLAASHFTLSESEPAYDAEVPAGAVVSQIPAAGERLAENETVAVVVSKGVAPIPVPDLSGLSFDAAAGALRALNLRIATPPLTEDSTTVPEGTVIRWTPTTEALPGSVITVVVSSGPPTVEVPKLSGLSEEDALAAVPKGLTGKVVRVANDATKGSVYATKPAAGEVVDKGSTLQIYVSTGPAFADVPDVIGLMPADASAALRKAGFKVGNTIGPADQPVLHTRPLRNTKQRRGTTVTLYTTDDDVPEVPGVAATATTKKPAADGAASTSSAVPTTAKPTTKPTTKPSTTPTTTKA